MSEENDNLEENDVAGLRKQYEAQKKELAEAKKLIAEIAAEKRTSSLTDILKAKGLKESAATHYQGEVSEDAVVKWATDLGLLTTSSEEVVDKNAQEAARLAQNSGGSSNALPAGNADGRVLGDPEQILHALNTLPYEDLVKLGYMPKDPNTI